MAAPDDLSLTKALRAVWFSSSAHCGSELGVGDVLVATTKQDCGDSCNPSEHSMIPIDRLPRYA
jgi:hypothetical protein